MLWNELLRRFRLKIHFAHRTFAWQSEARGKAHVHVVIIGFSAESRNPKRIYDYGTREEAAATSTVGNISPYLVEGADTVVTSRNEPLCKVPHIVNGSKQVDGGFLTLTDEERKEILGRNAELAPYIRSFVGSEELINGSTRWCLWLSGAPPTLVRNNLEIRRRVEGVKQFRLASNKAQTRESASTPTLLGEIRPIETSYLAIPEVSSERRNYVPIGFLKPDVVPSNKIQVVPNATLYHFGVISSAMHMAWMRQVTGRLKSDYSYSAKIVYNNFPWPEPAPKQRAAVGAAAQTVLDTRKKFPDSTLADLYDPLAMPPALVKAHAALDRAVDLCYRPQPFDNDRQRVEFLFALYEKLTAPLLPVTKKPRPRAARPRRNSRPAAPTT